jgi:glycosyl transferase family 10 (putative fucosyltransferase)
VAAADRGNRGVTLRLAFTDPADREFIRIVTNLLRTFLADGSISIVVPWEKPDAFIASVWRPHRWERRIPVILVTTEAWTLFPPHFPLDRYAAVLGLYPPDEPCNFVQYPYAAGYFDLNPAELYRQRDELLKVPKTKFCCFVVSNTRGDLSDRRIQLFREINSWRHVDSGGHVLNNQPGQLRAPWGLDFIPWIAQHRYMICLENQWVPGYVTEKPWQAWFAGTVPIYSGGSGRINMRAIIPASGGAEEIIGEIKRHEKSPVLYETMRRARLTAETLGQELERFEAAFRQNVLEATVLRGKR